MCEKSNCLIHTILLIVIYLLLLVMTCVSCYFYYIMKSKSKSIIDQNESICCHFTTPTIN